MADWMKVFKVSPRAVVVIVNEQREQPEVAAPYIRSELRYLGRTVIYRVRVRTRIDAEFAALNEVSAAEWVINMARHLRLGTQPHA